MGFITNQVVNVECNKCSITLWDKPQTLDNTQSLVDYLKTRKWGVSEDDTYCPACVATLKINNQKLKNFPFTHKGKEYWYSRSVAVVGFVFKIDRGGNIYVLANKRGKGTPDFQGYWNCPCGFLDFNETLEEAISREVKEETGYEVNINKSHFWTINSDPLDSNNQNVTSRYVYIIGEHGADPKRDSNFIVDYDEVEQVKWININMLSYYNWAFNHDQIIKDAIDTFLTGNIRYGHVKLNK